MKKIEATSKSVPAITREAGLAAKALARLEVAAAKVHAEANGERRGQLKGRLRRYDPAWVHPDRDTGRRLRRAANRLKRPAPSVQPFGPDLMQSNSFLELHPMIETNEKSLPVKSNSGQKPIPVQVPNEKGLAEHAEAIRTQSRP